MFNLLPSWFGLNHSKKPRQTQRQSAPFIGYRRLRHEQLEDRRMLAMLTVSVDGDFIDTDDGNLTLREAIEYVNGSIQPVAGPEFNNIDLTESFGTNDRIFFDSSLDGTPILLTLGELAITESVTIDASSLSNGLTIDAGNGDDNMANTGDGSRIFSINLSDASGSVTLDSLTITGGDVPIPLGDAGEGGGVFVETEGNFTLINSTVTGNAATLGGGLFVLAKEDAQVSITDSTIENNQAGTGADGAGGGAYITLQPSFSNTDPSLEIVDSTIRNNTTGSVPNQLSSGGGLFIFGASDHQSPVVISGSTISENTAYFNGGGIALDMTDFSIFTQLNEVHIINSTISGNRAVAGGGGISHSTERGILKISHSTIVDNEIGFDQSSPGGNIPGPNAVVGGGILVQGDTDNDYLGFTEVVLDHAIIAGNRDLWNSSEPNDNFAHDVHILAGAVGVEPPEQKINSTYSFLGTITEGVVGIHGGITTAFAVGAGNIDASQFSSVIGNILGPLQNNGGLTETHEPLASTLGATFSVIDEGNDVFTPANFPVVAGLTLTTDQRGAGFTRIFDADPEGTQIDIGAVEFRSFAGLPPTVTDVRIDRRAFGSAWDHSAEVSFGSRVPLGQQFKPISTVGFETSEGFVGGADTVEIQFSEPVTFGGGGGELKLKGNNEVVLPYSTFNLSADGTIATWTFNDALPRDKYAIHLSDSTIFSFATPGEKLDGDWVNDDNDDLGVSFNTDTPDDLSDDFVGKSFLVGDGTEGGSFRFHFAYLPGDSNGDGIVESAGIGDPDAVETTVEDIDGDGDRDADDVIRAQAFANTTLPLRADYGDIFGDDEELNSLDWAVLRDNLFVVVDPLVGNIADLNGDGFVNFGDLIRFQQNFQNAPKSAWHPSFDGLFALGNGGQTIGTPPQVLNLVISGSASTHLAFSFNEVDASGVPLHTGSGEQLRTVPVGGADTVSITFSEEVNVSAGSLYVVGLSTANLPQLAEFDYDSNTLTASWRFEGWGLLGDHYLLSLADTITDVEGNRLDGDWVNPASLSTVNSLVETFPSGDGIAGGRFDFIATLLPGDANLDGVVDDADFQIFIDTYMAGTINVLFTEGDFDGNGIIDAADFDILDQVNSGVNLQDLWVLADFDGDFDVDDSDIALIDQNYGMTGATWADGDLNGDGVIDLDDLDLAFAQFDMDLVVVS